MFPSQKDFTVRKLNFGRVIARDLSYAVLNMLVVLETLLLIPVSTSSFSKHKSYSYFFFLTLSLSLSLPLPLSPEK